jgi:hypothetical protein
MKKLLKTHSIGKIIYKSQATLLIIIIVFVGLGTYLILNSHAATPYVSLNASKGTLAGSATAISDTTASDGKKVVFGSLAGDANLLNEDQQIIQQALANVSYSNGEWVPSQYSSTVWQKYEAPALAEAALYIRPGGTAAELNNAVATLNQAIAQHQLSSGEFDDGTPTSGGGGVNSGFWVDIEGATALTLKNSVPASTLKAWEESMVKYTNFLLTGNSSWYANGNVVLRQDLIMLETYKLAVAVGDPNASAYLSDYQTEQQFLVSPTKPAWTNYGEHTNSSGGLWFDESEVAGPNVALECENGMNPCNGFDPNYTMAQSNDASIAYVVSGHDPFWENVVRGEYTVLEPLINNSSLLDAADGSRKNIPAEPFYSPVYYVLQSSLPDYNTLWSEQLTELQSQLASTDSMADPGDNSMSLIGSLAIPLADSP